ncbi:MAG: SpaH/EbpB family LPXTG-anchored major pilin [Schaalia hyovaginalis]|uniref:SpaH/EbpB family LPXTG-anchored major pilin n=1 Tax=Schaalia hyovaginalis TaxID=29316 RepID=UPI002A910187|nr:SpaH/EbpB family LPXTG-anchored major pilin [Schaalia hyovaginalis]MDY6213105.1 SpaH/EbpB family LPXTG-anchored major pilin [Schaalia hyovaginalis]
MRRLVPGAAATSLAALALAVAGPAFAASPVTDLGNINQDQTGTIKIHKYESGSLVPETASPTGTPEAKGAPVPGVVFTAYRITNVDPKKQADWEMMSKINVPADACGANWTTPTLTLADGKNTSAVFAEGKASSTTDAQGDASISDLPVGLYLLCETQAPASVQKRAMPFLVSMPTPNPTADAANGWLYEVNVYPKNVVIEAPKKGIAVTKNGLKTDDQIEYPVTVKVPSIAKTDQFKYFMVNDTLNGATLGGTVPPVVEIKEAGASNFTAVDATFYTVETTTGITVSFKRVGLAFLKEKANAEVRVTFKAKAISITESGEIPNTANFYVNTEPKTDNPPEPPTTPPNDPQVPPLPTNTVKSSWGDLVITKTDKGNNKPLSGATFEIYNAADGHEWDAQCTSTEIGTKVSVDGKTEFATGADGKVVIEGLFVDSKEFPAGTAEDAMALDHAKRCYVLKETAAPAGYVMPADPFKAVAIQAGTTTADDVTINNTRVPIVDMPMTGANGRLLMIIGGSALALTALGAAFILAKKRRSQDSKEQ